MEKEGEYGLQVTDLTPEIAKDLNVNRETAVVVVGVRRFKGSRVQRFWVQRVQSFNPER